MVCVRVCVCARVVYVSVCMCVCEVKNDVYQSPEERILHEIITKLSLHVAHLSLGDTTNDEYDL